MINTIVEIAKYCENKLKLKDKFEVLKNKTIQLNESKKSNKNKKHKKEN